ncbi:MULTISPECIES: peptidylprolyl isomerase [Rufibacter]|uniref:Peptidyl-prolyl cis-trans isomerase n=1 Tax=Rufibacter quisquiliarum TaxID=1549639 RepID=A0A839GPR0_9BACT|nr:MULTISPECIES: peptidylprolyl isomerase [Rufibacter]MBA9076876.1 peptidyl-prolyl cis-trans isomerase B (cyclophilin B) [Rufibacter quisquiliarum]
MRPILFLLVLLLGAGAVATAQKKSKKDYLVTIETSQGTMRLVLFEDTPRHRENFLKLVKKKFYDGTTFHRVINDFMIQGGDPNSKDSDPNNDGAGNPGYTLPAEILPHHQHVYGALAAARLGDAMNPRKESSGSQFYLVENHEGVPFLNNQYTVYGQVIDGLAVIDKIAEVQKDYRDRPTADVKMTVTARKMKKKKITKTYGYRYQ